MEKIKAGYVPFGTMFYEPANLQMISARAEKQNAKDVFNVIKVVCL